MSYDLMVFHPEAPPRERVGFMRWYYEQTKWAEGHSYNDPAVTTPELTAWFKEMIKTFPAMNGPFATDIDDNSVTDYCIGRDVIYVTFGWSEAERAYPLMKSLAEKHGVGFFDASGHEGDILFPDGQGRNLPIDKPGNSSSIQQIRGWTEQGEQTIHDVIRRKVFETLGKEFEEEEEAPPKPRKKWWQRIFG